MNDRAARDEVRMSARGLEPDEVGTEHALEDLAPAGEAAEQLGRRERDVQEERDAHVGPPRPQHRGHELQVVVVHPDRGAGRGDGGDLVGEALVDRSYDGHHEASNTGGRMASWYSGQIVALEKPS